jgi:hypothetical protein
MGKIGHDFLLTVARNAACRLLERLVFMVSSIDLPVEADSLQWSQERAQLVSGVTYS